MAQVGVWPKTRMGAVITSLAIAVVMMCAGIFAGNRAYGAQITARSLTISSNRGGEHDVQYKSDFSVATGGAIYSMAIEFCSNSALIEDACVAPWGFDALNAVLLSQSGVSGFTIAPTSTVSRIILSHAPAGTISPGPVSFAFDDIINPTDPESYYAKITTYASTDGTGMPIDFGALAFSINDGFDVSAEVPPYLLFCQGVSISGFNCATAEGDLLNLGELSSAVTSVAQSQFLVATNAGSGYSVSMGGGTMTSGNNPLPTMQSTPSQIGASQFGINLRANNVPDIGQDPDGPGTANPVGGYDQANQFRFNNGDILASGNGVQDYRKFTVSYVVNVSREQPPGVYATTLTYNCLANF